MKTIQRIFLFIFGCVLVRSLLIWWASREETEKDRVQWIILGTITTITAVGLLQTGIRRNLGIKVPTGAGGEPYWPSVGHGILYLIFTFLWFFKIEASYSVLITDLVIGVLVFVSHYLKINC